MSCLAPPPRSHSRASIAASDTTYHSFRDASLDEPPMARDYDKHTESSPASYEMRRQDSGYESLTPRNSPRNSQSYRRRTSTTSAASSPHRPRTRPAARRKPRSGGVVHASRDGTHSQYPSTPRQPYQQQDGSSYFHFPHFPFPDQDQVLGGSVSDSNLATSTSSYAAESLYSHASPPEIPSHPIPPQTTHYWTSDRTRRLEYAAIDAASKGVRGWVMRHMVPECFIPKDRRRLQFDDDRGSVVRYRLELEEGEDDTGKEGARRDKKRRGWWISIRAT
jgi:hypothetical protein